MLEGKTPGEDGLTCEFYSAHEELLAPRLFSLLSEFASLDSLPTSMEEAIVVLIPKPGKDPLDL